MLHTIKGRLNDAKCCIQEALRDHAQGPEKVDWEFVERAVAVAKGIADLDGYVRLMVRSGETQRTMPLDDLYPAAMAMTSMAGAQIAKDIIAGRDRRRRKPAKRRK